jgi:hypothetical protein
VYLEGKRVSSSRDLMTQAILKSGIFPGELRRRLKASQEPLSLLGAPEHLRSEQGREP